MACLVGAVGLRMTLAWDRIHRLCDDHDNAVNSADLRLVRAAWVPVLPMRSGPCGNAEFHRLLLGASEEFYTQQ